MDMISGKSAAVVVTSSMALALSAVHPALAAEQKGDAKKATEPAKKGANIDRAKRANTPEAQAVALAAMSDRLAVYGDRNKDALALITAARIQAQLGLELGPADGKIHAKPAVPARDMTVSGLLERARQYAGGRKDLIALADEVAKTGTRGAIIQRFSHPTSVQARSRDVFKITFRGGVPAIVFLSGDGDTDLDLIIKDENGNIVCRADGPTDDEICRWTPQYTGPFSVEVHNLGNFYNQYRIRTSQTLN